MKKKVGQLEVYLSNTTTPTGLLRFRLSPERKWRIKNSILRTRQLR